MTQEDHQIKSSLMGLETIWSELDRFFSSFSDKDWSRKHGKEWTFADMPYHLAYFNQIVVQGIRNHNGQQAKRTLQELNVWNDAQFANCFPAHTGANGLLHLHETQKALRDTAAQNPPDTPVFLPLIIVGGWRTLAYALEYILNHTWLHFTESHLRFHNRLPNLPPELVHQILRFSMETAAGALTPDDLAGLTLKTTLRLAGDGGGVWTFSMRGGKCEVIPENVAQPDAVIATDIATYLKTSLCGMQNPFIALLTGKSRIIGLNKARQFQKIFASTPSRVWQLVEEGRAAPE